MSAGEAEVRPATPEDEEGWEALVREHPRGSFFHLPGWTRVVQRVFGHEPRTLVALEDGRLAGVLPCLRCPRPFGRSNLVSVPYGVYGGPLALSEAAERALVETAARVAEDERMGLLELRYRRDPGLGHVRGRELAGSSLYATFTRELPEAPSGVLAGMPKKARAEARKARNRHGLEMSRGIWYLDDLYRMFVKNKHGLGSPALPYAMFATLAGELGRAVNVHLVRHEREPVAAVMTFSFGDTLVAYYSGTEPGADRSVSASNFMYMALQEWAVEQGYRTFDFGRSRVESGAYRFKVHQGFEPEPLHYRYHLVRSRHTPSFTPSNPRTKVLRNVWSRLPTWVVRPLSNRLSTYLP